MNFKKIFAFIVFVTSFSINGAHSQNAEQQIDPTKEFINSSLSFLKDKLKNSNLMLNELDSKQIKRSGSTYLIPSHLRLKGLASIPMLKEQIRVQQIRFDFKEQKEFGYKIVSIKKKSIFETLGLKKGDVIYQVNNRKVENDQVANEIFNDLKTSKIVKLDLIRNNEELVHNYKFS